MYSSGLRIAVLGPGPASEPSQGYQKRLQIREVLEGDGHQPFFPEDTGLLDPENPFESLLNQEIRLLSSPDVSLVVILSTSGSIGALQEIAGFDTVPEIKCKTAVLFPIKHYTPNTSFPANTARDFYVKLPYTDDHFNVCQLVQECRKWARDMQTGMWPGIVPFQL